LSFTAYTRLRIAEAFGARLGDQRPDHVAVVDAMVIAAEQPLASELELVGVAHLDRRALARTPEPDASTWAMVVSTERIRSIGADLDHRKEYWQPEAW
jgi:hypothetical protein